jgi:hypothetical protein
MERLTYWNETTNRYEVNDNGTIHSGSITDRLAEYEGTGLEPSEIFELQEKYEALEDGAKNAYSLYREYKGAEEQGLLIRTPCKVGDIVYANKKCLLNWFMFMEFKPYVKCEVINIKKTKTRTELNLRPLTERTYNSRYHKFFGISAIGKTVFLTREEAEAKLKGGANE